MQAMILAAGMGKRLGEYTKHNTKCMLEVNGESLIDRALRALKRAGITKTIIVVGYQQQILREYLAAWENDMILEYVENPDYRTTNNIYSLYVGREHLLKDNTLLLESDVIFDESLLQGLVNDPRDNLAVVDKYQSWMDGTVVTLDGEDNILGFVPKQAIDFTAVDQYYKTVNIYKFSQGFAAQTYVPFLEAYSSALGNNAYYEQVLKVIATLETQELKAYRLREVKWYEIDDPQDKDNAETLFANSAADQLERLQKRYGGYWRYPVLKDFCYLVNPYFPTPRFENELKAALHELISSYPSGQNQQCLLASNAFGVREDELVVGNGAAELIRALAQELDGTLGVVYPTFDEYPASFGRERVVGWLPTRADFRYDIDDLAELGKKNDTVLLVNPDNPTGHIIGPVAIVELAQRLRQSRTSLIVDESFIDFCDDHQTLLDSSVLRAHPNLIVIRSLGKSFGVAGIRLGLLATGNEDLLQRVRARLPIWNINSLGEFFLQVIPKYMTDYTSACDQVRQERTWLRTQIEHEVDYLRVLPSQANYLMCQVAAEISATQLATQLLERHVLVKDLTGKVGMQHGEYVRIAVRKRGDNQTLLNALREIGSSEEHAHTSTVHVQKPTVAAAAKSERWHGEDWAAARVSP
jgi:histidinol-phosphate/aromatic aminotransferase/cobyric acid decarboxylase-like protein/choline kinase